MNNVKYIGLDVHKNSIAIAIADQGCRRAARIYGTIHNDFDALDKFCRKMVSTASQLQFVYEAGPCGYGIYRHLNQQGFDCAVVAPSLIPRKSGERIKTDHRDAKMLAQLHRAGELTAVYVPDIQDEAMLRIGVGPRQPIGIIRNHFKNRPYFGLKRIFLTPKWGI